MQNHEVPILSIIIVNYNVRDEIINCIESIKDHINPYDTPYEVIVSDNGSSDGSVEAIRKRFPWVNIIENNANLGFGKANNIGAKIAKGSLLCFLNPDTLIKNGIKDMIQYLMDHQDVGFISPVVYEPDGVTLAYLYKPIYFYLSLQLVDLFLPPLARLFYTYQKYQQKINLSKQMPFSPQLVHGCIMVFKKEIFFKIGGFDEQIFMYGEETDIWFKLKRVKIKPIIFPYASIIHLGSRSVNKVPKLSTESRGAESLRYLLKKYFPFTWYMRYSIELMSQARQVLSNYITAGIYFFIKKDYKESMINARKHTIKLKAFYRALISRSI